MTPVEQAAFLRMILDNLDISFSMDRACSCCPTKFLKIELKYADEVISSDTIYLSSLKEDV